MKKRLNIVLIIALLFALTGCGFFTPAGNLPAAGPPQQQQPQSSYTVTFVYNNGNADGSEEIAAGERAEKPADPVKDNHIFNHWHKDQTLIKPYDFDTPVNADITVYAGWVVDYEGLTNKISTSYMKANITILVRDYDTAVNTPPYKTHLGSGIIFHEDGKYYYALTNNHVTLHDTDYNYQIIQVIDYAGNTYNTAQVYDAGYGRVEKAEYDLAVVRFKKTDVKLKVIERETADPDVNGVVAALGQPLGQYNALTYGAVSKYEKVNLANTDPSLSNVEFPVIKHSASIDSGSSGGALLNIDLKLVGINYAGPAAIGFGEEGSYGCAVPIEKINEFIDLFCPALQNVV